MWLWELMKGNLGKVDLECQKRKLAVGDVQLHVNDRKSCQLQTQEKTPRRITGKNRPLQPQQDKMNTAPATRNQPSLQLNLSGTAITLDS